MRKVRAGEGAAGGGVDVMALKSVYCAGLDARWDAGRRGSDSGEGVQCTRLVCFWRPGGGSEFAYCDDEPSNFVSHSEGSPVET